MRIKLNHIRRAGRRKYSRLVYGLRNFIKGGLYGVVFGMLLGVFLLLSTSKAMAQSTNANCGGTSQPRCEVVMPLDDATVNADTSAREAITAAHASGKALLENIDPQKFHWTFIPNIPTADCQNILLVSPAAGASTVTMDICTPFNTFKRFITGVLAVLCLIGCAHQIQSAIKA